MVVEQEGHPASIRSWPQQSLPVNQGANSTTPHKYKWEGYQQKLKLTAELSLYWGQMKRECEGYSPGAVGLGLAEDFTKVKNLDSDAWFRSAVAIITF